MRLADTYTITLENMNFFAHIGVGEDERKAGEPITVCAKITAEVRQEAFVNDDFTASPDYSEVYRRIAQTVRQPVKLLERLACKIGEGILGMQGISGVEVSVTKVNPPVGGDGMNATVTVGMLKNIG